MAGIKPIWTRTKLHKSLKRYTHNEEDLLEKNNDLINTEVLAECKEEICISSLFCGISL